jgi:hypothetical protein
MKNMPIRAFLARVCIFGAILTRQRIELFLRQRAKAKTPQV